MNFRIADRSTDNLAWLTGDEQKAVETTAFDQLPQAQSREGPQQYRRPGRARITITTYHNGGYHGPHVDSRDLCAG